MSWVRERHKIWRWKREIHFPHAGARKSCHIGSHSILVGCKNLSLGAHFSLEQYGRIEILERYRGQVFQPRVNIGDRVQILYHFHLGCIQSITIGEDTLIGSYVTLIDHDHGSLQDARSRELPPTQRPLVSKGPIVIGPRCWIGEKASVLSGVTLGEGAVVAAHALVTQSVPAWTLVGGVPARPLRAWNAQNQQWEKCTEL